MKEPLLILTLFLLSASSLSVAGTHISLSTQISLEEIILKNETQLGIRLINSGDETAYQVQVHFLLPSGFQTSFLQVGNLAPHVPYVKNVTCVEL